MGMDRRFFFKQVASSAAKAFHNLLPHSPEEGDSQMTSNIFGDLTPELLAMEAERLGLDPEKDRQMVLESVQAAMGCPINEDDPM
jgi:hypothetical protein